MPLAAQNSEAILQSMVERATEGEDTATPKRSSFASTAALTYGTNMAVAVLSLLNVLIVSRVLGPSGRGAVVFLTAIGWLVSSLATFGVEEANANLAASHPKLRRALATNSLLFSAIFGISAIIILNALIAAVPAIGGDSALGPRWTVFCALPLFILGIYLKFLVQADFAFKLTNVVWLITPTANVTLNGVLAIAGVLSVESAVATWVGGEVLGTLILVWYVARRLQGFGRPSWSVARRTLSFGLRSHAGRILLLGNYRLDQWILGAVAGARELGLYSVAVAWSSSLFYLPTTLQAVQRPDLVRASRDDAAHRASVIFRRTILITVVPAVVMIVVAPFLCGTLMGQGFADSVDDLRVLTLGVFGIVALKLLGNAITAQRKPGLASIAIGAGFVCTVVLDVLLIPRYGGLGAAFASTIAYTLGGVIVAVMFVRALGGRARELVPRASDVSSLWAVGRSLLRRGKRPVRKDTVPAEH
jgi:O-antigen/teichoic acid export membrane protein